MGTSSASKARQLAQRGIPVQWRALVYLRVSGAEADIRNRPGEFHQLAASVRKQQHGPIAKAFEDIEKDLRRTFNQHPKFREASNGQRASNSVESLRRILCAFAIHAPEVGYVQGMNSLAGMLLLLCECSKEHEEYGDLLAAPGMYEREERAFWLLVRLVNNILPPAYLGKREDLGLGPMQGIHNALATVQQLAERSAGEFLSLLDQADLSVSDLVLQWMPPIFVGTLPPETALRIWDLLFTTGESVICTAAVALLAIQAEVFMGKKRDRSVRLSGPEGFAVLREIPSSLYDAERLVERIVASSVLASSSMSPKHTPPAKNPKAVGHAGRIAGRVCEAASPAGFADAAAERAGAQPLWFERHCAATEERFTKLESNAARLEEQPQGEPSAALAARLEATEAKVTRLTEIVATLADTLEKERDNWELSRANSEKRISQLEALVESQARSPQRKECSSDGPTVDAAAWQTSEARIERLEGLVEAQATWIDQLSSKKAAEVPPHDLQLVVQRSVEKAMQIRVAEEAAESSREEETQSTDIAALWAKVRSLESAVTNRQDPSGPGNELYAGAHRRGSHDSTGESAAEALAWITAKLPPSPQLKADKSPPAPPRPSEVAASRAKVKRLPLERLSGDSTDLNGLNGETKKSPPASGRVGQAETARSRPQSEAGKSRNGPTRTTAKPASSTPRPRSQPGTAAPSRPTVASTTKRKASTSRLGSKIEGAPLARCIDLAAMTDKTVRRYLLLSLVSKAWHSAVLQALGTVAERTEVKIGQKEKESWRAGCLQADRELANALSGVDGAKLQSEARSSLGSRSYATSSPEVRLLMAVALLVRNDVAGLDSTQLRAKVLLPLESKKGERGGATGSTLLAMMKHCDTEMLAEVTSSQWATVEAAMGAIPQGSQSRIVLAAGPWVQAAVQWRGEVEAQQAELLKLLLLRRQLPVLRMAQVTKGLRGELKGLLFGGKAPNWHRLFQQCTKEDAGLLSSLKNHRKFPVTEYRALSTAVARCGGEPSLEAEPAPAGIVTDESDGEDL